MPRLHAEKGIVMWLSQLNHKVWNLLRWDIEHNAYWSNCDANVLYGVSLKCAEGGRILGYHVSPPAENRDTNYYKTWITDCSRTLRAALERWEVLDCSLTKSVPVFEDAARRVRECSPNFKEIVPETTVLIRPAES